MIKYDPSKIISLALSAKSEIDGLNERLQKMQELKEKNEKLLSDGRKLYKICKNQEQQIKDLKIQIQNELEISSRHASRINFVAWCIDTFRDRPTKDADLIMNRLKRVKLFNN